MKFNPNLLEQHFSNIKKIEENHVKYVVLDQYGSEQGQIAYFGNHQWAYYLDNFPHQKKYFNCDLPVLTIEQLAADVARTGLVLVIREAASTGQSSAPAPNQ